MTNFNKYTFICDDIYLRLNDDLRSFIEFIDFYFT